MAALHYKYSLWLTKMQDKYGVKELYTHIDKMEFVDKKKLLHIILTTTNGKISRMTPFQAEMLKVQKAEQALVNLVRDALKSPRLSEWEKKFVENIDFGIRSGNCTTEEELSQKQQKVLGQIEQKVYAVG